MKVNLVSYTVPNIELQEKGIKNISDIIAYCARVSNPSNQFNIETNQKLINYLVKNKHWSPMETASICLEITTTRDIARQILRHRSFSFQEFSQRYADPTKDLKFETKEARLQDTKNRQNSIVTDNEDLKNNWETYQNEIVQITKKAYQWAIEQGIAKEQARAVLPEGMTESRLYMNGTVRSWIHYIDLRSGNGTQKEHRDVAIACADAIEPVFPMIREFVNV